MRRESERGDLRLVGIAHDVRDAGQSGKFLGCPLGVAAGDNKASIGIFRVQLTNGVAGLRVSGCGNGAGVDDDDVGGARLRGGGATPVEELTFEGGAIGMSGAAAKLLNEEASHLVRWRSPKTYTEFMDGTQ